MKKLILNQHYKSFYLLLSIFTLLLSSFAQVEQEDILMFLDIPTVITSKKSETLSKASGMISVIDKNMIKALGVQTVSDVMRYVNGLIVYDSYLTPFNQIAIRNNIGGEHYNSKILFMVNGHPSYDPVTGGFELNFIPIQSIEKIEVVRGPVSVIYGTNALSGVINIITKKTIDEGAKFEVEHKYGTFETNDTRVQFAFEANDLSMYLAGSYSDSRGMLTKVKPDQDESGLGFDRYRPIENTALFLNLNYKNLEFDFSYGYKDFVPKYGLLINRFFLSDQFEISKWFADIRYHHNISESIILNTAIRYDNAKHRYRHHGMNILETMIYRLPFFSGIESRVEEHGQMMSYEVYINQQVNEQFDYVFGVLYSRYFDLYYSGNTAGRVSPVSPWVGTRESDDLAFYLNMNYKFSELTKIVGGTRYADNKFSGSHMDYRFGIVQKMKDNLHLKFLFGTSYRSPNALELFTTSTPIITGDEDLRVETLDGLDLILFYTPSDNFLISFDYFWNRTNDFIKRQQTAIGAKYTNIEGEEIQGLELEIKYRQSERLSLFINASILTDHHDLTTNNDLLVIENVFSGGFHVGFFENSLMLTNSNVFVDDWGEAEQYVISNIGLFYNPPLLNRNMEISLEFNNVFDEEYEYAEFSRRDIVKKIPGGLTRTTTLGVKVRF